MSSKFTHNICKECWREHFNDRVAIKLNNTPDLCCFCGKANMDCIYVRHDPNELLCKGDHQDKE